MAVRITTSSASVSTTSGPSSQDLKLTGILLLGLEETGDLLTDLTLGHLDIVLGVTIVVHQRKVAVVGDVELKATS